MEAYKTFQQAVEDLIDKGYTTELNLTSIKRKGSDHLNPKDFIIEEVYLFDETGKPGAETILIALSSKKHGTRILVVNAFVSYTVTNWAALFQHFKDFIGNLF